MVYAFSTQCAQVPGTRDKRRSEAVADIPRWWMKGDWFDVCSCDIACPCTFGQAPDNGKKGVSLLVKHGVSPDEVG